MFKVKTNVCPGIQFYAVIAGILTEQACVRELTLEIQVTVNWVTLHDPVSDKTLAFMVDYDFGTVASWIRDVKTREEIQGPDFEIHKESEIEEYIQKVFGMEG